IANLKGLDELVRRRIDADEAFGTVVARLPALATRVRSVADLAVVGGEGRDASSGPALRETDRPQLMLWSAAGLEGITMMLAMPAARSPSRIDYMKADFAALAGNMD